MTRRRKRSRQRCTIINHLHTVYEFTNSLIHKHKNHSHHFLTYAGFRAIVIGAVCLSVGCSTRRCAAAIGVGVVRTVATRLSAQPRSPAVSQSVTQSQAWGGEAGGAQDRTGR